MQTFSIFQKKHSSATNAMVNHATSSQFLQFLHFSPLAISSGAFSLKGFFSSNSLLISSKCLPFVSGKIKSPNITFRAQTEAYRMYEPLRPKFWGCLMVGKVFTTRNMLRFPKQFATPVNSDRASNGNNSAEMKYQINREF